MDKMWWSGGGRGGEGRGIGGRVEERMKVEEEWMVGGVEGRVEGLKQGVEERWWRMAT